MRRTIAIGAALMLAMPAVAGASVASAAGPAAPSPRAIKAVDTLMALSGNEAMMDGMVPHLVDAMLPILIPGNTGQEAEIKAILREEFISIMGALKPDFAAKMRQVYLDHFSADELEDMAAFMGSPTGQKMAREMVAINGEMMTFGQSAGRAAVAGAMPRIIDRMRTAKMTTPSGT